MHGNGVHDVVEMLLRLALILCIDADPTSGLLGTLHTTVMERHPSLFAKSDLLLLQGNHTMLINKKVHCPIIDIIRACASNHLLPVALVE